MSDQAKTICFIAAMCVFIFFAPWLIHSLIMWEFVPFQIAHRAIGFTVSAVMTLTMVCSL